MVAHLKQKTLSRDGATIHYWTNEKTNKPAIFFMHGAAMDHQMFDKQYTALDKDYFIITWDARGHGESRPIRDAFGINTLAQDCLDILKQLQVSHVTLLGQSEGGMIAQEAYRIRPQGIRAIITVGASPIMLPYSKLDIWLLNFSTTMIKLWPYDNFMKALALRLRLKKMFKITHCKPYKR